MSRIWGMMDIGKRSLVNSQTGLQTVSHNIANKGTEGYSRQRVEFQANEPSGLGKLRIGQGARSAAVTRTNNSYLEKQIEKEGGDLGTLQGKSEALQRVEQVFNEQNNKGLNKFLSDFFNSFRDLSNSPESLATRTLVKESADYLAKDFHRVHTQLTEIQGDIDFQMAVHIDEINGYTREVAQLNEKIQIVELSGGHANDERDRRELLVKKMGELINIRYAESDTGALTITAGNTGLLVSGSSSRELFATRTSAGEGKREGNYEIFYKPTNESTPVNLTRQLTGGRIGGLLSVRDKTINRLIGDVNEMAYRLGDEVNKAHSLGFDRYDRQGVNIFDFDGGGTDAALGIRVNKDILEDVGRVVSSDRPQAPGNNRVANILSSLQFKPALAEGTANFDEYYSTLVGQVGVEANRANSAHDSQKDIVKQLKNLRESISGVSLDEETTKMIEYQKSFDASARLVRTADEMMDTILSLKRM